MNRTTVAQIVGKSFTIVTLLLNTGEVVGSKECLAMEKQLDLDFGFSDKSDFWKRGYCTGLIWGSNYIPGGPHIYTAPCNWSTEEQRKKEVSSRQEHSDYMKGFEKGLESCLLVDRQFAKWYDTNKNYRGNDVSKIRFFREKQGSYLPLSSVGRALALQARGRLFETDRGNQFWR